MQHADYLKPDPVAWAWRRIGPTIKAGPGTSRAAPVNAYFQMSSLFFGEAMLNKCSHFPKRKESILQDYLYNNHTIFKQLFLFLFTKIKIFICQTKIFCYNDSQPAGQTAVNI
ncbi:MAG: hypothetical protein LBO05_04995 [Deltaproteobacteria bacterium]|jgi:hypothetical protein|nr:hypothetical protein [Deltaproteobacteria bacterium]